MKKIILVVAIAIVTMVSNAQVKKVSWGVRVGLNIPSIADKSDVDGFKPFYDKNVTDFNVGAILDWSLTKSFYIQPGIYFTKKGAKLKRNDPSPVPGVPLSTTTTGTVSLSYLQIPILASYRFNLGGDTKLHINAGPYFALAVDGQTKTKTVSDAGLFPPIEKTIRSRDISKNEEYKKFDGGLTFNIGANFSKIYVGVGYDLGLINIASDKDRNTYKNYKMKNQVFNISVGYNF